MEMNIMPDFFKHRRDFNISLIMHYECNFECGHCCYNCGPDREEVLPEEDIKRVITQASELGKEVYLTFSGGEPTLRMNILLNSIKLASDFGLHVNLRTNCHWAQDPSKAKQLISKLESVGLEKIVYMPDQYHNQFSDCELIINNLNKLLENSNIQLNSRDSKYQRSAKDTLAFGRGKEVIKRDYRDEVEPSLESFLCNGDFHYDIKNGKMVSSLNGIYVHPSGNVGVCCWGELNSQGNIKDEPLPVIIERLESDSINKYLQKNDLTKLKAHAFMLDSFSIEDEYNNKVACEFCMKYLSDEERLKKFRQLFVFFI